MRIIEENTEKQAWQKRFGKNYATMLENFIYKISNHTVTYKIIQRNDHRMIADYVDKLWLKIRMLIHLHRKHDLLFSFINVHTKYRYNSLLRFKYTTEKWNKQDKASSGFEFLYYEKWAKVKT